MNVVNINDPACEHYRQYFDAYLDSELPVDSRQEVLLHLCRCSDCAGILDSRGRMKQLLRGAVSREGAPVELTIALRGRFRTEQFGFFAYNTAGWMVAAAVVLILAIGVLRTVDGGVLPNIAVALLGFRL